jgi:hypothetical protein
MAGVLAVCVVLGTLALAGCGSSSSSSEPGTAAFVSGANAACEAAYAEALRFKAPHALSEVPAYERHNTAIANKMLGDLMTLSPPKGKQAEFEKMLGIWKQQIQVALARGQAAQAGDEKRNVAYREELRQLDRQFDSVAGNLGLAACSRNV